MISERNSTSAAARTLGPWLIATLLLAAPAIAWISKQDSYLGINDPLGLNPKRIPFSPIIFTDFAA